MGSPLFNELERLFLRRRLEDQVAPMERYMRNKFHFFGVKTPEVQESVRCALKEHPIREWEELVSVSRELYQSEYREYQYAAIQIIRRAKKLWTPVILDFSRELIVTKSWWDTVDAIASNIAGAYLYHHPNLLEPTCLQWLDSNNMWLQRTALICQLTFKERTNTSVLFSLIQQMKEHEDFFIRKAIGWALRQYAYTNPQWVSMVLSTTELSPLSKREAGKHLKNLLAHETENKVMTL